MKTLLFLLLWTPTILPSLPDFSHAGYHGADADLPMVEIVERISAIPGDNTAHLQEAIDRIAKRPVDVNGIRGALLLEAGLYRIYGTVHVSSSGIVIRGVGQENDTLTNTVLRAMGDSPHQRDVLVIGGSSRIGGQSMVSNTKQMIMDNEIPVGSYSLQVANASAYQVGDPIVIYHPCTISWLEAVNYGGVPYPDPSDMTAADERWKEGQLPILYHRYIKSIEGNTITLDSPIFYTLNKSLSASYVYTPKMSGTVYECGVENLRIEVESKGGEDENHAWNTLRFRSAENCWAFDCTFVGFGHSGIILEACRRSTFTRCSAIDPVAIVTGERMYNFNTYLYSQLNLFSYCYARSGRHHYVSNGTSTASGNVFLYCISDHCQNANEGHRQWTQGMLYDAHKEVNLCRSFVLGLYNRVAMGTGHGWAAVNSVLWNCDVDASYGIIGLQQPPTAQNYAIGCKAKNITGQPVKATNFPLGYVEGTNRNDLSIPSLYLYQLDRRKATSGLNVVKNNNKETRWLWQNGQWVLCVGQQKYLINGLKLQ